MENAKKFDAVEDAILSAYQSNKNSRRRVQIKSDQFKNITMVEVFIGNVKTGDYKYRARFFKNNQEVFTYWMPQQERCPIIAKMMFEGYTQKRISELLGLSTSTINKDVRYMREATVMLDGFEFRARAEPVNKGVSRKVRVSAEQHAVH
jgi:DNA-binding NarL/FixJ family response regulator